MKAKFSNKTKEEIYERDLKCCIICWNNSTLQFHHVYFGMQSNRWKDRNNTNQWVCLCSMCHNKAHSCKTWEWIRQACIYYIIWS